LSEIRATTISNAAGTGPITLTKQHAAKVWASVKSDNSGFNDSFNCSSLADNGTGDGTPSFTNAMSNANYAHNLGHRAGSLTSGSSNQRNVYVVSVAAGNINLKNSYTTTGGALIFFDVNHTFSINGDLA
tara:strand:+ start:334 stop:723 length:390 start_codon:yes stop_codon:yes gene_type:complete